MAYQVCRHIKTNGRRCQAPAIHEDVWCYFHDRFHTAHGKLRRSKVPGRNPAAPAIGIPFLEDHDAIQLGISLVVTSLETGVIGDDRAKTLFRGLELAAKNLAAATPPIPSFELPLSSCQSTDYGYAVAAPRMSNDPHLNGPCNNDRLAPPATFTASSRGELAPPPVPSEDDEVLY